MASSKVRRVLAPATFSFCPSTMSFANCSRTLSPSSPRRRRKSSSVPPCWRTFRQIACTNPSALPIPLSMSQVLATSGLLSYWFVSHPVTHRASDKPSKELLYYMHILVWVSSKSLEYGLNSGYLHPLNHGNGEQGEAGFHDIRKRGGERETVG